MQAIETTVPGAIDEVDAKVRAALGAQGFGVLTEIDVAATLRAKLGVERPPLRILGACNPGFANRALSADVDVALLLPCNVVLEELDGAVRVSAVDPRALLPDGSLEELATEAAAALTAAVDAVAAA